jgi:hypothetical protein
MKKSKLEHITNSFKKMIAHVKREIKLEDAPVMLSRFKDLIPLASKELPEHKVFFDSVKKRIKSITFGGANAVCDYILELLVLKKDIEDNVIERKIFQGAEDKLKEAGFSFGNDDKTSVISNLDTCIELTLKDKLNIPTTITKINTNKIIEICIADEVGPVEYLKEIKKHVLEINNKVKHIGYSPSKKDCIDAIKATEDFLQKAKEHPFNVTAETRNKIYSGL